MLITLENYLNMAVEAEYLLLSFFFSFNFQKRKYFWSKTIGCFIFFIGLSFLFQSMTISNTIVKQSINYLMIFITGPISLMFCFDYPFSSSMFLSVTGYSFRHLVYLLWELLSYILRDLFKVDMTTMSYIWFVLAIICIIGCIPFVFLLYSRLKQYPDVALPRTKIVLTSFIALFINIILNTFVISYDLTSFPISASYIFNLLSFLGCLLILLLLFGNVRQEHLEEEIHAVNQLRHQEEKQYKMSKENIDLINIKCHDLRHQIRALKNSKEGISQDELNSIEKAIRIYDTSVKTGNQYLDFILQDKSLLCQKNQIVFDSIIDGNQLSFMKENDIYSLFGNIIDNGIEACLKIKEEEKRVIRIKVKKVANGIFVYEENPYEGNLELKSGFPLTSKEKNGYHGFGLKSIQHIVNQYKGTMKISLENQRFCISIYFLRDVEE